MANAVETVSSAPYQCKNGSALNLGSWWADPVKDPTSKDSYFFCGGNVPSEKDGRGTDRCIRAYLNSCRVEPLSTTMSISRQDLRPVCLTNGQCYLFGGNTSETTPASMSVDRLTVRGGKLSRTAMILPEPRLCYAAAAMDATHFLITGGYGPKDSSTNKGPVFDSAILVDSAKGTIKKLQMNYKRGGHSITKLPDGRFLIVGGSGNDDKGAEVYDPKTMTFTKVEGKMLAGRKDHRAVLARDGKVYILGGTSSDKTQPKAIEVFDPVTQKFSLTGMEISVGREDLGTVYIKELNIIVSAGGEIKGAAGEPESTAIDVIDLGRGKVTSSTLPTPMDETQLVVRSVDAAHKKARVFVLVGQKKIDGKEVSLPATEIEVSL